jgi:HTH-type transcriptional repressor of NAD biosynthesis genes
VKRFKTGVCIGKFYPPHRGHHFLVDTALANCERVFVLICVKPEQTIPGEIRRACLQEAHPEADVRTMPDIVADDDSPGWAAYTIRFLGQKPDAVFTSEGYGDAYAKHMDATHICVDRARKSVPISGTQIRNDALNHLDWLHPVMRAFFVKRVVCVGAESTGTTTLAQALAAHFKTDWVPEYGREYCLEKFRDGITDDWHSDEFVHIAREQMRRENELARRANKVLICDTDAFATGVWHQRYLKTRNVEVERLAAQRPGDLYMLTGDEIPFVQDGIRDGEHIRHWMHGAFAEELAATGRKCVELRGPHEARLAHAIEAVNALLK